MTDRVPGAPGQYKAAVTGEELLKLQAGQEFTITMTRDDQPIVEGTPYSKAAVLPDELAAQLCPGVEDPTPADAFQALRNLIYPVGAIYLSVLDTDPAVIFGGTWEKLKDRFLLGAGDTYKAGAIGGETSHALTVEEMPSHRHTQTPYIKNPTAAEWNTTQYSVVLTEDNLVAPNKTVKTSSVYNGDSTVAGGSQAHNNMPPYLAVYMWKRVA